VGARACNIGKTQIDSTASFIQVCQTLSLDETKSVKTNVGDNAVFFITAPTVLAQSMLKEVFVKIP
jgi:hypothetical protein